MQLTPAIDEGRTVKLVPEVGKIDADGSLGELLRSGQFGDALREKVTRALLSAVQKGTNLEATVPPAAIEYATLREARFVATPAGQLGLLLVGEVKVPAARVEALLAALRQAAAH
jgi:hypothetical protein